MRRLRQIFFPAPPAPAPVPTFAAPAGSRIYAVGDIHGRSTLLASMLAAIARDVAANPPATIHEVFLGDYIDRGMHSRAVIDLLVAPPPAGHTRTCLMGNHEATLLRFLDEPGCLRDWANFGGYATLAAYGIAIPSTMGAENLAAVRDALLRALPPAHLAFLRQLPLTHTLGDYLFVHAGIAPSVPLASQKPEHLLWIRDMFLRHEGFFDHYVVHGHSPVATPDIRPNRANLDISEAAVDSLCCLVIEGSAHRIIMVTTTND